MKDRRGDQLSNGQDSLCGDATKPDRAIAGSIIAPFDFYAGAERGWVRVNVDLPASQERGVENSTRKENQTSCDQGKELLKTEVASFSEGLQNSLTEGANILEGASKLTYCGGDQNISNGLLRERACIGSGKNPQAERGEDKGK